jgi:DNA-binding NarL/FixJ family response regulator
VHKIRVLCVDDHHVVLEGLASLIDRQADMQLVGRALSAEQGLTLFQQLTPDICLADLRLPGMSGLDLVREIRKRDAHARIIVLTMYQGDEDIYRALENGAATYLLKDALSADLIRTIRDVYEGHGDLPDNVAARLAARSTYPHLTPRETQVLRLCCNGYAK